MKPLSFIIAILFFFYSCKETIPGNVIGPEKMQMILWDLLRADALSKELVRTDSSRALNSEEKRFRNQVFQIHKITDEQFSKSYAFYTAHPVILKTILDSLNSQQVKASTLEIPAVRDSITGSNGK